MTARPGVGDTPRTCDQGLAQAFAFLGKRWNGVLLGTLADGPAGFAELARALPGISESVLSDRLGELCRVGLVSRTVREGPPVGVSYQLTDRGAALAPALEALARWAHENLPAAPGRGGGC
ncbi:helix-turn-helix domain-containing protein [Micromonospora soli]|uniref:winged helix-turn-helix transcriptional regulator n=1 Tax=Micromonospora sp. NBRC 110009 TaxID=3061627 RepID=UPI00267114D5|nr:helix-turn-helix domain-containing protein [Micromonospora sp. NBRC 110009]WKT97926.1 helix-turn-helix domain-containing protein [Micromonospora sp. NBRC 110009]